MYVYIYIYIYIYMYIYIYIYKSKSYANHNLTICSMLLVTVRSILTGPNKLTVPLHYINVFQPKLQWQCKANIWEELPIHGITLHFI